VGGGGGGGVWGGGGCGGGGGGLGGGGGGGGGGGRWLFYGPQASHSMATPLEKRPSIPPETDGPRLTRDLRRPFFNSLLSTPQSGRGKKK